MLTDGGAMWQTVRAAPKLGSQGRAAFPMGARGHSPQAGLGCVSVLGRGWWSTAGSAPCFTSWAPGPIQVEELGCLEVEAEAEVEEAEAEARAERCRAAVPLQPPALVSEQGFCSGLLWVGAGWLGPALVAKSLSPAGAFPGTWGFGRSRLALGLPGV